MKEEIKKASEEIDKLEQEDESNRKRIIIILLLFLVLLAGIFILAYSVFSYTKKGDTDNEITTGELRFLYTENTGVGHGINITNAYPVEDSVGKAYSTENYVFDFKITASLPGTNSIPYEVTAEKKEDSTLDESAVKIYLVKVNGSSEEECPLTVNNGTVKKFSELTNTELTTNSNEKTIFTGVATGLNYEQNFRLRMWISNDVDFAGVEQPDGSMLYPYSGKTFKTIVNVYSVN